MFAASGWIQYQEKTRPRWLLNEKQRKVTSAFNLAMQNSLPFHLLLRLQDPFISRRPPSSTLPPSPGRIRHIFATRTAIITTHITSSADPLTPPTERA